ncbi:MAG: phage integrase SAM-like domain-containing protein, partial [Planctomycetota bacterium]
MRTSKPFFRTQTKSWYVQLGKRQINLGKDEKAAWKKYHELMLEENEPAEVDFVVDLLDQYLDWLFKHRKPGTYKKAKHYLSQFAKFVGRKLRVGQLTPRKVSKWIEDKESWGPTTSNDAISVVQRAFNWGINNQLINKNPIVKIADK